MVMMKQRNTTTSNREIQSIIFPVDKFWDLPQGLAEVSFQLYQLVKTFT